MAAVRAVGARACDGLRSQVLVIHPLFDRAGAPAAVGEVRFDPVAQLTQRLPLLQVTVGDMRPIVSQHAGQRDVIGVSGQVVVNGEITQDQDGCDGAAFTPPAGEDSAGIAHREHSVVLVAVRHSCVFSRGGKDSWGVFEASLVLPLAGRGADPPVMLIADRVALGKPTIYGFIDSAFGHAPSACGPRPTALLDEIMAIGQALESPLE